MAIQTVYRHSFTEPVRGKEIDVNFDDFASQLNRAAQFALTASASVANNSAEATLLGTGTGSLTIPANTLIIGRSARLTVAGVYSTINPPGTLRFRVRLGGLSGTVVLDTGDQTPATSASNRWFELSGIVQCRTIGATGTVFSQGKVILAATDHDAVIWDMEKTATVTIDTTVSQTVDMTVDWQTADAGNTITGSVAFLEIIG